MKILMISLDKNIIDSTSRVARRMIEYGKENELFILIPHHKKQMLNLSGAVHVLTTGGRSKFIHFFGILKLGRMVIKENGIKEITTQDPFFIGLIGWLLKILSGVRLEVQLHGDFFGSSYYGWRIWLGKWVVRRADKLRAVGERIKKSLLDLGINEKKVRIMPVQSALADSAKFFPKFDIHDKYGKDKKIFLAIGRLEKVKNLDWLIDAFHQVTIENNETLLLMVGSGSEEKKLKEKVEILGLADKIKFESWTADPLSYIKTADCLMISSLSEGYGLTAMEAFALGTQIVMTDVGVANYELKPCHKVKILPVGDKEKFVQEMFKI